MLNEDNLDVFENRRRPQLFENGRQTTFFGKLMTKDYLNILLHKANEGKPKK